jgi:hypothetical protein
VCEVEVWHLEVFPQDENVAFAAEINRGKHLSSKVLTASTPPSYLTGVSQHHLHWLFILCVCVHACVREQSSGQCPLPHLKTGVAAPEATDSGGAGRAADRKLLLAREEGATEAARCCGGGALWLGANESREYPMVLLLAARLAECAGCFALPATLGAREAAREGCLLLPATLPDMLPAMLPALLGVRELDLLLGAMLGCGEGTLLLGGTGGSGTSLSSPSSGT